MRSKSLLLLAFVSAGIALCFFGYGMVTSSHPLTSGLKIRFPETAQLANLPSGEANRVSVEVHNTTKTVARIVGNNAC